MKMRTIRPFVFGALALLLPHSALALDTGLQETATVAGLSGTKTASLPVLIGQFINAALGLIGVAFLIMAIYAGFLYLTSQGDPKEAKKGMDILKNCVIGLIIIFSAYAIVNFVISALVEQSGVSV